MLDLASKSGAATVARRRFHTSVRETTSIARGANSTTPIVSPVHQVPQLNPISRVSTSPATVNAVTPTVALIVHATGPPTSTNQAMSRGASSSVREPRRFAIAHAPTVACKAAPVPRVAAIPRERAAA